MAVDYTRSSGDLLARAQIKNNHSELLKNKFNCNEKKKERNTTKTKVNPLH